MPEGKLGYGEAVAISWAVNWRLAIANILLMFLMAGLVWIVRPLAGMGALSAIIFFVLNLMVAWPYILRKVLSAHSGSLQLLALGDDNHGETLSISYWKSILLALAVEAVTIVIALATVFALALAGVRFDARNLGAFNLLAGLLRLFIVMPAGIKIFARERQSGYPELEVSNPL